MFATVVVCDVICTRFNEAGKKLLEREACRRCDVTRHDHIYLNFHQINLIFVGSIYHDFESHPKPIATKVCKRAVLKNYFDFISVKTTQSQIF